MKKAKAFSIVLLFCLFGGMVGANNAYCNSVDNIEGIQNYQTSVITEVQDEEVITSGIDNINNNLILQNQSTDVSTTTSSNTGTTMATEDAQIMQLYPQSSNQVIDKELQGMNEARSKFKTVTVGDTIYAIGGMSSNGIVNTIEKYDKVSNSWTIITTLPINERSFAAAVMGNKIYISGGYLGSETLNNLYSYDLITGQWSTLASMRTRRERHSLVYANGLLYAIGGRNETGILNTVEAYDFSTDKWTYVDGMSIPRMDSATAVQDNKIFVIGGFSDSNDFHGYINMCVMYDTSAKMWTCLDSCGTRTDILAQPVAVVYGDNIHVFWKTVGDTINSMTWETSYRISQNKWSDPTCLFTNTMYFQPAAFEDGICLVGGYENGKHISDMIFMYRDYISPQNLSLKEGIAKFETVSIGGETYIVGGHKSRIDSSDIYKYNKDLDSWSVVTSMPTPRRGFSSVAVGNEIYIFGGYYDGANVSEVIAYDVTTGQWRVCTQMPVARERMGAAVIGNTVYLVGGRVESTVTDETYSYDTVTQTWSKLNPLR